MVQDLFLQGKDWFAQQSFEQINAGASQQMCSCCVRHKSAMGTPQLALRAMPLLAGKEFLLYGGPLVELHPMACGVCGGCGRRQHERATNVNTCVWPAAMLAT